MFGTSNSDIDRLETLICRLDTLYDNGEDCIDFDGNLVSDNEYDAMVAYLFKSRPNSKIFDEVTASERQMDEVAVVIHDPPMTSISKAPSQIRDTVLQKWIEDVNAEFHRSVALTQAYKLDGVACRITWKNGNLISAGLRPRDGVHGEDVTENIKYVEGVPVKLNLPLSLSVSGEIVCYKEDFDAINNNLALNGEKLRANPRNHTAGAIRQYKDPTKTQEGKLRFIGYSIENFDKWESYYADEMQRAIWANKNLGVRFIQVRFFNSFQDLQKMEENVPDLPYMVDGVVISVFNLEEQEQMGRHGNKATGSPRGKIAWKFKDEVATASINEIVWQVGRTGRVTPVAMFNGVQLAGTTVRRCTLNNVGWMERMGIGIGTKIEIIKSGAIIPKAIGVVSGKVQEVNWPREIQGYQVKRVPGDNDAVSLICENHPATRVSAFGHFLTTLGVKGLGPATIEKLAEEKLVDRFGDFYKISIEEVERAGLSTRQALLTIASIHMIPNPSKVKDDKLKQKIDEARLNKKKVPAWQFFASLGIPTAGKTAGKALVDHFGNFDSIQKASMDEIASIEGIGEKTAQIIVDFFKNRKEEIEDVLQFLKLELPKQGKLTGKTFCFSGSFDEGKSYWEKMVEDLGGKCSSSVSKNTDYLVAGPGSGSKSDKAKSLGIKIIDVDDLSNILGET